MRLPQAPIAYRARLLTDRGSGYLAEAFEAYLRMLGTHVSGPTAWTQPRRARPYVDDGVSGAEFVKRPFPTAKVPRTTPSLARNLVTVPLPFVLQMFAPSKATPVGFGSAGWFRAGRRRHRQRIIEEHGEPIRGCSRMEQQDIRLLVSI